MDEGRIPTLTTRCTVVLCDEKTGQTVAEIPPRVIGRILSEGKGALRVDFGEYGVHNVEPNPRLYRQSFPDSLLNIASGHCDLPK